MITKSKIFLFFCLSFIIGVFIQSLFGLRLIYWLGILILGIILAAIFWHAKSARSPRLSSGLAKCECAHANNGKIMIIGFCLMISAFGAWRYIVAASPENSIKQFNDKGNIVLQGKIIDEPDVRADNVRYKVKISNWKPLDALRLESELARGIIKKDQNLFPEQSRGVNFESTAGNILLVAKKYPEYNYGDILEISGKLKTPRSSEDFDYQKYLAKDDIYSVVYYPETKLIASGQGSFIKAGLFWVKNKFENSIGKILTEPQSSLLAGLILGEKRGFSDELMADFSATGTTHIIALSGFNITIIAVALMNLFNFFMVRRRISFCIAVVLIILFVVMTGASASAVRAAVMGILVLIAQQAGRLYTIRNALIFAGAVMIYFNPKVLTFDLGFQLSFAATLGLIYIGPILQNWIGAKSDDDLPKKSFLGWREILVATLSAQIAVLPLLLVNFGQLSLVAPLVNLLILLFIPSTMFFGFLAGLAGIFWLGLGKIFGWLAWLLLTYEIKTIEFFAKIPLAAIEFRWSWVGGGIYYIVLVWLIWYSVKKNRLIINH